MSDYELVPYHAGARSDYLRLLREAWGDRAMSPEAFDWWFGRNPAGSLMSLAVRDSAVVGVAGHTLVRLVLAGRERLAQFSVHAVTAPSARGLGIFQALERRHEDEGLARDSACVLAFASAPTRPLFLGPLGWSQIDRRRVWGRPLRALVRRLTRRPRAAGLGPPVADDPAVRRLERFGQETDAAYATIAPGLGNHVVRDSTHLNWRYVDAPRDYRAFTTGTGYAVLGHDERKGASVAILLDLVAPPSDAPALVRRCAAEARGAEALFAVPTPSLPRSLLTRLGFVPTPVRLDFMGKGLATPLDAQSSGWTVTLGDTDFL